MTKDLTPLFRNFVKSTAISGDDTMVSFINTPNVEVTGAARLYRAASVWTAGLGVNL
jgi:hypothetical protein